MGTLEGFGHQVPRGIVDEVAVVTGERFFDQEAGDDVERLMPLGPLGGPVDAEPPSSASELDSPVPNSTRPSETRSRVAILSAYRAGWLKPTGNLTMP